MPQLKALFEAEGFLDVRTLIQSGNVVFRGTSRVTEKSLEKAIADHFGLEVDVMVRTTGQMKKIVADNPFPKAAAGALAVGFMKSAPGRAAVNALDVGRFAPEDAVVVGTEVYFYLPNGMGRTKVPAYVGRQIPISTTIRNWNTTIRLLEMMTA